jgi:hypothetical protein
MMKKKASILFAPILLFTSFVTTGFLLEQSPQPETDNHISWLSSSIAQSKNLFSNHDSYNGAVTYSDTSYHIEPLLLLLLGTVLLSVVACINVIRTRRITPHFNSANQTTAETKMRVVPRQRDAEK